jgi:hypothetical protein
VAKARGREQKEQKEQEEQEEEQEKEEEAAATEKEEPRLLGTTALSTPWEIMSASTSCQQALQPLISCRHRVPASTGGQGLEEEEKEEEEEMEEEERKEKPRKEKRLEIETRPPRRPRLYFLPPLRLLLVLLHRPLLPALLPSASPATTRSRAARKSARAAPLRWASLQGSICWEGACQT